MSDSPGFRRAVAPWWLAWPCILFARLLYRVRWSGAERLPEHGGVLLVANHLSYVDVVVLQMACPRAIRFVGYEGLTLNWFFRLVFRLTGTIPVSSSNALEAMRKVRERLVAGEVVLMFPEGAISRTGQLMKLQRGYELMARRAGVPVMPVFHDGLWGSVFSFSGGRYLWKAPRVMRTPVFVAWGEPLPAERATADVVRQQLLDLGCEAFSERPLLRRHLGREIVRGLARRPWKVEFVDRTVGRRPLTAAMILGASAALSRHLRKTVEERRVGIVLPPGAGAVLANLGVLCAGKIPVNLNFTAGKSAIESSLRMAGIRTVLTADAVKAKVQQFPWPEDTRDFREVMTAAGGKRAVLPWLIAAWVLPNQLFAALLGLPKTGDREEAGLLFTSGSSGEPKGVVLTHRNILANCAQIASLSILPPDCVMLGCLPVFHSFGFTVSLWYPLWHGCRVVTVPSPLDTRKIVESIRDEQATVMVGAPTFLRPLLKRAEIAELRSLQVVVSGAEKLPDDLHEAFRKRFHLEIFQGYGLTETSPATNVNQPDPWTDSATATHQQGQRFGSVGRMMPGMTARILHPDTMAPIAATEAGIVAFRGDNIFGGYLGDEEKTKAAFHDGWFVTGDLGRFDEDGFLTIEGRLSRFSKIGGEMVPHGTVEQRLLEALGVTDAEGYAAVVTGVPDAAKGEQLVLLTTLDVTAEQVRDALTKAGLPNLWIPRDVRRVEAIPVLGTGKLDLKGVRNLALQG